MPRPTAILMALLQAKLKEAVDRLARLLTVIRKKGFVELAMTKVARNQALAFAHQLTLKLQKS